LGAASCFSARNTKAAQKVTEIKVCDLIYACSLILALPSLPADAAAAVA